MGKRIVSPILTIGLLVAVPLVMLLAARRSDDLCAACVFAAVLLGGYLVLLRDTEFPHRGRALSWSWLGPLMLIMFGLHPPEAWLKGLADAPWNQRFLGIGADLLWYDLIIVFWATWLLRGYGAIILLALASHVFKGERAHACRIWAEEYPRRNWFGMVACAGILGPLLCGLTLCAMHRIISAML